MRMLQRLAVAIIAGGAGVAGAGVTPAEAAPVLTIAPLTFNVIGLDSNDVTAGPNTFPVGARVCNTGSDAATDVAVTLAWASANPYIDLDGAPTRTFASLAPGACTDVQWQAIVQRAAAAYDSTRRFHITASALGFTGVRTPTPRELYVEHLISQNRNRVLSITGPAEMTVGDTATLVLDASTAPGGYEQLETFLDLPASIFEFVSIDVDYSAPAGATNAQVYADACGWDHDPTSATYRTCVGPENYTGGKAGGDMQLRYTIRAVGAGTAALSGVIYDQSGSSYHYNADYGREPNLFTITVVPAPAPAPTSPAPAGPAPPVTTAPATPAAVPGSSPAAPPPGEMLSSTGQPSRRLALLGLSMVSAGAGLVLMVGRPTRRSRRQAPSPLALAAADFRVAVGRHRGDPAAQTARRLLAAVEAVGAALGQD
jgi:hypothetical protein